LEIVTPVFQVRKLPFKFLRIFRHPQPLLSKIEIAFHGLLSAFIGYSSTRRAPQTMNGSPAPIIAAVIVDLSYPKIDAATRARRDAGALLRSSGCS